MPKLERVSITWSQLREASDEPSSVGIVKLTLYATDGEPVLSVDAEDWRADDPQQLKDLINAINAAWATERARTDG